MFILLSKHVQSLSSATLDLNSTSNLIISKTTEQSICNCSS